MIKLCLVFFLIISTANAESYVGILENQSQGGKSSFVARAVFKKSGDSWKIGEPSSDKTNWSATFDGKSIGNIETSADKTDELPSSAGLLNVITPNEKIPQVGTTSQDYATWIDITVKRPLVLTTGNFKGAPDQWKRTDPSKEIIKSVVKEFRKKFPFARKCKTPDSASEKWKYADSDVKIERSYKSSKNFWLVRTQLNESTCDGPPDEHLSSAWYLVEANKNVSLLNTGTILVDAGDYDGDGSSELIFQIQRYNRGGYIIYWDSFKKNAEYTFGYH